MNQIFKTLLLLLMLAIGQELIRAEQIESLPEISQQNRAAILALPKMEGIYEVESNEVGPDGAEGNFYRLAVWLSKEGTIEDFQAMIRDPEAVVRAMSLVCLLRSNRPLPALTGDDEIIAVTLGCMGMDVTLELFSQLLSTADWWKQSFLDYPEE
ncbi:MAG: hypothetical protein Q7P63_06940 [Verrucomicrobiota bacterium JB022]|nr:hypothetical protein [Verrucomicrobiota bacterium JB022]